MFKRMFTENEIKELAETVIPEPTPTPEGLEVINVSKGDLDQETGIYALVISAEDKAKVLANPQNCVIAFAEEHVGTAYAYFTGVQEGAFYQYIFNFVSEDSNNAGTFPAINQTMIGISENMDGLMEQTYTTTLGSDSIYECGVTEGGTTLTLTSDQLQEICSTHNPKTKIVITAYELGYSIVLNYDGHDVSGNFYFAGRKPSSSGGTVKFVITYDAETHTYTQVYTY